jgi:hypothetical protein
MVHLGDVGHVESHFAPFGDSISVSAKWCTVCAKHIIGSKIFLNIPDGTPRCDEAQMDARFWFVWR